jgi:hypothetical protein
MDEQIGEAGYAYDAQQGVLVHYYDEIVDGKADTYRIKENCLADLGECSFSYSDGADWLAEWSGDLKQPPCAVKIVFRFKDESQIKEFMVRIPVGG